MTTIGPSARQFIQGPLSGEPFASGRCIDDFRHEYERCVGKAKDVETGTIRDVARHPYPRWLPPLRIPGKNFPYQQELIDKLIEEIEGEQPICTLLALPTGAGKTHTALSFLLDWFDSSQQPRRVLWFAPTIELLEQASAALEILWFNSSRQLGLVISRKLKKPVVQEPNHHIMDFTTVQKLLGDLRRGALQIDYDFAIYDEAHQAAAPATNELIRRLTANRRTQLLGLSATPGRASPEETADLVELFRGNLLTPRSLRPNAVASLQAEGILAKLEFETIEIGKALIGQRRTGGTVVGGRIMRSLALDRVRFQACIRALEREVEKGRRVLVFAASIAHACAIAAACRHIGLSAAAVSGKMKMTDRLDVLDNFRAGRLSVLCNSKLLALGYDLPVLETVLLTVPVMSAIQFEQVVGRVSRGPASGGTETGVIIDLDNHLSLHGLPESYHRFEDFEWDRYRPIP